MRFRSSSVFWGLVVAVLNLTEQSGAFHPSSAKVLMTPSSGRCSNVILSPPTRLFSTNDRTDQETTDFVNDGPMAWMKPYLDLFGMTEGNTLNYALPSEAKINTTDEQAAQLRKEAARTLTNIGREERQRRGQAANVFAILTAVYAVWAALVADNGGLEGHLVRFGTVLPLFFTFGYKLSEETGL
ncbi:hypothetical protein IV203_026260 [Nitzschia inconspicua]|uniref:Uncharacterized protein n=1 Tax=Nitzschia inconspicua TaxID=303405 RepID=A0A9K3LIA2_9STRA|nr:hypothetical protein IV203_026260 [Nitzschia inconspicua]